MSAASILTPTQRYAAGALFGIALQQAQAHQTSPLGLIEEQRPSSCSSSSDSVSVSDDPLLWVNPSSSLLRPIFKFLEIDEAAWTGLEETATFTPPKHHVGAYMRLLAEDSEEGSSTMADMELGLSKGVDAMAASMETTRADSEFSKEKQKNYANEYREKYLNPETTSKPQVDILSTNNEQVINKDSPESEEGQTNSSEGVEESPVEEVRMLDYPRKVTVLYELLSACLANAPEDNKNSTKQRKGYDARHRVALRLLSTWFDVNWIKMEAIETLVASSAMAILKAEEAREDDPSPKSKWAKWKRGGIIGAAALTGGTLLAITGGLAAPAIAAGFGALAPTLGTIIPVIGASGFAAVATAAGSVAGSVAVAASFGAAGAGLSGSKMARRIGDVKEFEFKPIGENHNQGRLAVEILISGFVFEEEDFKRPWEGQTDNMERYALQWESDNLIAVSTAIQDWLTSTLALELMKRGAMMTVLSSIMAALAWPAALLALTDFIDSKWSIAVDRSDKAGIILAEVLLKGLQGQRPVTLVGFSLGARVIFKCLEVLADSEHGAGLVERVVLLGAPISIKDMNWEAVRKVVAGRFVNAYSSNDWMLGVAFRASLLSQGLAGIQPVEVPGIQNVDVASIIEGHSSYLWTTQHILEQLELETYYPVFNHKTKSEISSSG